MLRRCPCDQLAMKTEAVPIRMLSTPTHLTQKWKRFGIATYQWYHLSHLSQDIIFTFVVATVHSLYYMHRYESQMAAPSLSTLMQPMPMIWMLLDGWAVEPISRGSGSTTSHGLISNCLRTYLFNGKSYLPS